MTPWGTPPPPTAEPASTGLRLEVKGNCVYERETNPTHVGCVTWDSLYLTESSVLIIVIPPLSLGLG